MGAGGLSPLPPHFNHWYVYVSKIVTMAFCSLSKSIEPRVTKFGIGLLMEPRTIGQRSWLCGSKVSGCLTGDCLYKHNVTADFSDGRTDRQTNEIGKTISRSGIVLDFRRI